jgi:acetyltransferase EpsM
MEELWIYGAGGHASVIIDILKTIDSHKIVGIIDDSNELISTKYLSFDIVGNRNEFFLLNMVKRIFNIFITIGDNATREKIVQCLPEFQFPILIHPAAIIGSNVTIGAGTVIMPGAIIEANSKIGQHCIINNHAIVGHGSQIGDFCHISGGVILCGGVVIGKSTLVGAGSCIAPALNIGSDCKIGVGSSVTRNVIDKKFMLGNPARVVMNNN